MKSKRGKKLLGIGIVGLVVIGVAGFFIYKKMKDKGNAAPAVIMPMATDMSTSAADVQSKVGYYNPYSYNARHALMSSISPAYMHKGYFSAPQHSIGSYNGIPAFSFNRDEDE